MPKMIYYYFIIPLLFSCVKNEDTVSVVTPDTVSPQTETVQQEETEVRGDEPTLNTQSEEEQEYLPLSGQAVCNDNNVRIRDSPSIHEGSVIGVLHKDDKVRLKAETRTTETIDGRTAAWYELTFGEITGWVFGGYIDKLIDIYNEAEFREQYRIIQEKKREVTELPVTINPDLEIPWFGYAVVDGVYFWIEDGNTLYAFNGENIYPIFHREELGIGFGDNCFVVRYSDNSLYIVAGRLGLDILIFEAGYILNLDSYTLREDNTTTGPVSLKQIDPSSLDIDYLTLTIGFKIEHNNILYGIFREEDMPPALYAFEKGTIVKLFELSEKYCSYEAVGVSENNIISLYIPTDGWTDEPPPDRYMIMRDDGEWIEVDPPIPTYEVVEYSLVSHEKVREYRTESLDTLRNSH